MTVAPATVLEMVRTSVMLRLLGPDPSLIDAESRWVLWKFLYEVPAWKRVLTVSPVAGQRDYPLALTDPESAVLVTQAYYGDTPLAGGDMPPILTTTGAPSVMALVDDRTFRVYPTPTSADTSPILVEVALTLLPTAEATPPALVRAYFDVLLEGTLGRLYMMPDKTWTNLLLAQAHLSRFEMRIARAKRKTNTAGVKGSQFMSIPFFA